MDFGEPYYTTCPNCDHAVEAHPLTLTISLNESGKNKTCSKCACPLTQDHVLRTVAVTAAILCSRDMRDG